MAKVVLGNDPFRRSAAPRTEAAPEPKPAAAPVPAPKPGKAAKAKPPAAAPRTEPKRASKKESAKPQPARTAPRPKAAASAPKTRALQALGRAPDLGKAAQPAAPLEPATRSSEAADLENAARRGGEAVQPSEPPMPDATKPVLAARAEPVSPLAAAQVSPVLVEGDAANDLPPPEPAVHGPAPLSSRALGALALARDILLQTLDRPGLKRVSEVAEGLLLAIRTGMGLGEGRALDPFGRDPALLTRLEPLLDFLYERYWRVTVENAAALPTGPAILVANHAGALPLDGPVLALAVSRERPELREARWLVEDQVFHAPFWGTLLNRLGAIRASPENAIRLLEEGRPVLVFPEGVQGTGKGYRERYRLKRFGRGGFVKLAWRTGAPIVPVAIVGSEEATPMLAKLPGGAFGLPYVPLTTPVPLPVRWAIRFGSPIQVQGPERDELAFVQHLTERTRGEIEAMLQSLLRERRR